METLKKIKAALDKISTGIAAVLLALMMVIVTYNVFARFLGGGITWYMESAQYLNVWAEFLVGIALCATGQHLRIDALEQVTHGPVRKTIRIAVDLVTILFYVLMAYGFTLLASRSRQVISTLPMIKMRYVYALIPIICAFSAFGTVVHLVLEIGNQNTEAASTNVT
jgi:TRAP-type C4-dicarboxylate transport system permease small subunit